MRTVKAYGEVIEIQDYRIKWLSRIVYSSPFELLIAFVILVNAISLALLTMPNSNLTSQSFYETLDQYAFYVYVGELLLRMTSYGTIPIIFKSNSDFAAT